VKVALGQLERAEQQPTEVAARKAASRSTSAAAQATGKPAAGVAQKAKPASAPPAATATVDIQRENVGESK
jgi:hypothetical protein